MSDANLAQNVNSNDNISRRKSMSTAGMKAARRTQDQGVRLIPLILKSVRSAGLLLAAWLVGYRHFNVTWVLVSSFVYVAVVEYRKTRSPAGKQKLVAEEQPLARVDELPSWVYFPDVERAEWLNKMIQQMWPYIGIYIKNMLKSKVEPIVNSVLPSKLTPFTFNTIDLGTVPPRVGGVKVYIDGIKRDEIIMDMEVVYASDANLKVSHRGLHAGVKDVQVSGTVRIVVKPLVNRIPIIGGLNICFLHQPKIDFDLTDVANLLDLPLLSSALRTVVSDQIANFLVLPNKITVNLMEIQSMEEVLFPLPKGVVQVFVKEAADLRKADIGFMGRGKSDPYCKITVGMQCYKTKVIEKTVTPVWDQSFEFIIRHEEKINIEVFDEDPGDDDKLGRTSIDIASVEMASTLNSWYNLDDVKTGRIHLIAKWLHLNNDPTTLSQAKLQNESSEYLSTAFLLAVVDSAKNLPLNQKSNVEPSPYVVLHAGNTKFETAVKESATNPKWEEKFEFMFSDPMMQELSIEVLDSGTKSGKPLGTLKVSLNEVLLNDDMTVCRPYSLQNSGPDTTLTLRLCMRILTLEAPAIESIDATETSLNNLSSVDTSTLPETTAVSVTSCASSVPLDVIATNTSNSADITNSFSPSADEDVNLDIQTDATTDKINSLTSDVPDLVPASSEETHLRLRKTKISSTSDFGQIQLTLRYSVHLSQLVVIIHQCTNLIPCDADNLADPYVRLHLLPDRSSSAKRKTQTIKNNLNPVFDEKFEWSVAKPDISKRKIHLMVKNSVGMFSKDRVDMGQLQINLSNIDDITSAITCWYDLEDPSVQM